MSLNTKDLVVAMEKALAKEYKDRKEGPLPTAGQKDRELLFAAIARGVLQYLESHQNEFVSTIKLKKGAIETSYTVTGLDLNIVP